VDDRGASDLGGVSLRLTPTLPFWEGGAVHCSVWRFVGDPDDLEERYVALLAEIPESNHALHAAARTPDGLLIFDTCPSEEVYRTFFAEGGAASALFEKHGLVPTTREDYPVIRAFGAQSRLDEASL
jgi:hypothetical protein